MAVRNRSLRTRNTTTTLGTSALIALGGLGCGQSTTPTPTASSAPSIVDAFASSQPGTKAPPIPKEDATVVATEFARHAVALPNIAQCTLYTWTKLEQIEALQKDPTLLTKSESPENGTSFFEQILEQRAQMKDPLAKLLRTEPFARQRYAWTAPFATRIGIGAESYGDELIQIVLKPDAWFVILKMSSSEIAVVDANNKPISKADALAHPERLTAAYFVQDQPVTGYRASMAGPNERLGYREYVLFNESMIASYSVGTPEIAAELENETRALERLLGYMKTHETHIDYWQKWMVEVATKTWESPTDGQLPIKAYEAALAFADFPYYPTNGTLGVLIDNLRKLKLRDKPFTHVPSSIFPAATTSVPPKIKTQ